MKNKASRLRRISSGWCSSRSSRSGIVFYYALTDSITGQFTLANLSGMGTYLPIFLRSIWLALFASLICLVIGYPVAYFIAQCKPLTQRFLEMLIMLPMCMSFLLRTLAWVGMLEDTGIINSFLAAPSASRRCRSSARTALSSSAWCITICRT